LGYRVVAADLCAAGVGAPHIRQRLWWVAYTADEQYKTCEGAEGPDSTTSPNLVSCLSEITQRESGGGCSVDRVGDTISKGSQGRRLPQGERGSQRSPWSPGAAIDCLDGVTRRTQPGVHSLAHGVPGRVGRLRAYGNAIVPQVAAEFVMAYMECRRPPNSKEGLDMRWMTWNHPVRGLCRDSIQPILLPVKHPPSVNPRAFRAPFSQPTNGPCLQHRARQIQPAASCGTANARRPAAQPSDNTPFRTIRTLSLGARGVVTLFYGDRDLTAGCETSQRRNTAFHRIQGDLS
jgi:hypothetical protein